MEFIKKFIGHELVSGSLYLFIGTILANILAFLLNLFLARSLSYSDYGIFATLLSVFTLAAIPSNSINTIVVKFVASYYSKKEFNKISYFYKNALKVIIGISIFIFIIFAILAPILNEYLHLNNIFYIFVIAVTIVSFYLWSLNLAFLQSLMKFALISFINSFGGFIKLITGIILIYLGFRVLAGLWSIFFMTLGSFFIAFIPLFKILKNKHKEKVNISRKEIIKYSIPAFLTVLFLTSFTSSDVILVKHFFNSTQAGFYAGLSLVGKVIFYFTGPIPMVMFPLLVKRHSMGQSYRKLFYLALILVAVPSLIISLVYFTFPDFIIKLFLGGREYLILSKYLGIFALYLTIFSLINVCVGYFLSFNETKIAPLVIFAAILQIIFIYFFHQNFYQIIEVSIVISLGLLISLLTYYFKKSNL